MQVLTFAFPDLFSFFLKCANIILQHCSSLPLFLKDSRTSCVVLIVASPVEQKTSDPEVYKTQMGTKKETAVDIVHIVLLASSEKAV